MATPNPGDEFDWSAAEADVVDLNARRAGRPENWSADIDDEHDEIGDEPVPVDLPDAGRRRDAARDHPGVDALQGRGTRSRAVARRPLHPRFPLPPDPAAALRRPSGLRAPRGLARTVSSTSRWVSDAEGRPVRLAAVRRETPSTTCGFTATRQPRTAAHAHPDRAPVPGLFAVAFLLVVGSRVPGTPPALLIGVLGVIGSWPTGR